jgi:phosphate uptake regulator
MESYRRLNKMTLKKIFDALTKQKKLESAYKRAGDMLKRDQYMFNEVCNALLDGGVIRRTKKLKKEGIVEVLSAEDKRINELEISIRKEIFQYLALNTAPDITASLILASVIIDMERIGDYTKDLAKIALIKPPKLTRMVYVESIKEWKGTLVQMFDLTHTAFVQDDDVVAKQVMQMNRDLRADTDLILMKLEKDAKIRSKEAIIYTLYMRYFRRVSAHLENVASSVAYPFPYIGFKAPKEKKHKEKKK